MVITKEKMDRELEREKGVKYMVMKDDFVTINI